VVDCWQFDWEMLITRNDVLRGATHDHKVAQLKVLRIDKPEEIFCLKKGLIRIGRASNCDVIINSLSVSKYHCELNLDDALHTITDKKKVQTKHI